MKNALITGGNSGIGLATAQSLAQAGYDLILLVRSHEKGETAKKQIQRACPKAPVEIVVADLEDLHSVQKAVVEIRAKCTQLNRLINNAGYSPDAIAFNEQGYEKSFVANHLGHFVLTTGLLDLLAQSGEGRIINVSSMALNLGKFARFFEKNNTQMSAFSAYGDGKLANALFAKILSQRLNQQPITVYSLHPGVVSTGFGSNFTGIGKVLVGLARPFMINTEQGAATSIYLATTPLENIKKYNGGFFAKSKPKNVAHRDFTEANAALLWTKSEAAAADML
jgi:retinol dehydrogenase 12